MSESDGEGLERHEPPRRVLLVTPRLLDSPGGRAATDLALRLDRRRFEPAVCCYDGWGPLARELHEAGIEIFPLRRRAGLDPTFPIALAHEIRRRRIDVVHGLNARRAFVLGTLGGLLAGVPTAIATFRDTRLLAESRRLAWAGRLCGEIVRTVVATSEEVRAALLRERWVPPGKTVVVPDGVNVARFQDGEARGAEARRHWAIPGEAPLVGAVLQSRRSEELALLLGAFERLRARRRDARMLVAGTDPAEVAAAGAVGVGTYGDGPAFYAAVDALCVTQASRTVPLTLLEGLAAGVPVAASRREGDEAWTPRGAWAFAHVTGPGEAELAGGLGDLLDGRRGEASELARAGKACVETEHSIDANVERVMGLYQG